MLVERRRPPLYSSFSICITHNDFTIEIDKDEINIYVDVDQGNGFDDGFYSSFLTLNSECFLKLLKEVEENLK